jgi:Undecaprenyl-phosphate glucose phosphotransferase
LNQVVRPPVQVFGSNFSRVTLSYQALQAVAAAVDGTMIVIASVLGFAIYQEYLRGASFKMDVVLYLGIIVGFFFIILSKHRELYKIEALCNPAPRFKSLSINLFVSLLIVGSLLFLLKIGEQYSRGSVICLGVLAFLLVPLGRLLLARVAVRGIRSGLIAGRRAVLIGDALELERLASSDLRRFGIEEVARVGVLQGDGGGGLGERGRLQIASAIALARELRAAEFVLMLPWGRERLLAEVCDLLRPSPLSVRLLPDSSIRNILSLQRDGRLDPALAVEIQREPLGRWERLTKRTLDLSIALAALTVLAPLLLVTAVAIRLDSAGPALFRQRRVGFDNREFMIFKFRTMTTRDDGDEVVQARRGDARITRVGRLLRRSSIDELPQLLNVVLGDMSLVGPRPHAIAHHDRYGALIASYALRHNVKPGLTGMAQIRGLRGETRLLAQMEKRVEQDVWYINNWSLALDLVILARTCLVVLHHDAY